MPNAGWAPQHGHQLQKRLPLLMPVVAAARPAVASSAAARPAASGERYISFTEGNDGDEFVIQTLVGEFIPKGDNHGRPFYQKAPYQPGAEPPEVFIYYWDERDGPNFNGWWFGKSVGGNEVWSHCPDNSLQPPSRGWKIPFAGGVRSTFCLISKSDMQRIQQRPGQEGQAFHELGDQITKVIEEATTATEQASTAAGDYSIVEILRESEQALAPHAMALVEMERKLRGPAAGGAARAHAQKLRVASTATNAELTKLRLAIGKALKASDDKVTEEKDRVNLQELIKETSDKANHAEDMVERAVITYALVEQAGDDAAEAQKAVEDTEAAALKAQAAMKEALAHIGSKLATVRRFESEAVRNQAPRELNSIRDKLKAANQKLTPLLTVRQDFKTLAVAKIISQEVLKKLTPAEVEIDKAADAVAPLRVGSPTAEMTKHAEQAIGHAQDMLVTVQKILELRLRTATGVPKQELEKVELRSRAAQKRLDDLRNSFREVQERQKCSSLLPEVGEKMHAVHQAVNKAESVLSPCLADGENIPIEETLAAIEAGDEAMKAANKATSNARIIIAMKLVEVKRFTAEAGQEALRQLQDYQRELDVAIKKIADLKAATADCKQTALQGEAEMRVRSAEELVRKVDECFEVFADKSRLAELSSSEVRDAGASAREAEAAAQKALREAQAVVTRRQIEAKGSGASEEDIAALKAYQERIRCAQAEVAKSRILPAAVEEQLVLKRIVDEAGGKVSIAEEKVSKAAELVEAQCNLSPEAAAEGSRTKQRDDAAQTAKGNAQMAVKGVVRYLDVQARSGKILKGDMAKLRARVKEAQEKLDSLDVLLRMGSEKAASRAIISEVEQRVQEAETMVQNASVVAAPFLAEEDEVGGQGISEALARLKEAVYAGGKALGSAKTFLAVKKIAAKRLMEAVGKTTLEELTSMQSRLEAAAKSLNEIQKGTSDRKYIKIKQEIIAKFQEVEEKAAAFKNAVEALVDGEDKDIEPVVMKDIFEKAGGTQSEAQAAVDNVRSILVEQLRDTKPGESAVLSEFKELLAKLKVLQGDVDKYKKMLNDSEQRFVAKRLLKDAVEMFEELERKLEQTNSTALPLVSTKTEEKEDFAGAVFLTRIAEALRQHAKQSGKSFEGLFKEISGEAGSLSEANFVTFVQAMPELIGSMDAVPPSEEQLKGAFAWLGTKGSADVTMPEFLEQLRSRYFCTSVVTMTDSLKVEGGKPIRKLDVWEVVEALSEPEKDDEKAVIRVMVKAERDAKEGYCTLSGQQGTEYLEPVSAYTDCLRRVDVGLQETLESINQTMAYLKQKSDEISSIQGAGSLGEVKAELMKMRVRASKAQAAHSALKRKVSDAQRQHEQAIEEEKSKRQEAIDKTAAAVMISEAGNIVDALQAEVDGAVSAAEELASSESQEDLLEAIAKAEHGLETALASVKGQEQILKTKMDEIRSSAKAPFVKAQRPLSKLKAKLSPLESRCKEKITALRDMHKKVCLDAQEAVAVALRALSESLCLAPDALFAKLSDGDAVISADALRKALLAAHRGSSVKASQLNLGLQRYKGLTQLSFLGLFQQFKRCVKDIALTTAFEVKSSSTIRKIDIGEYIEVIGDKGLDEATGLERVTCRALRDLAEGWVTIKGNQGTAFLEQMPKPFFLREAGAGAVLSEACETASAHTRAIDAGEVFEVLEGPRREPPLEVVRIRGKAVRDGKKGWATLKDPQGPENFERLKLLVCRGSIALTSAFDIGDCVAIRKLEVGETMEQLEDPQQDEARKLTRVHVRAKSDGREGWTTMKGNQGTAYLAASDAHYACLHSVLLEKDIASGSKAVRQLNEGEIFEVLEGPCIEEKQGALRVRGRSLRSGGGVGWFTAGEAMQPWSSSHRCVQDTELFDACDKASATVLRSLDRDETVEALETPFRDASTGILCLHVRADKDGAVGFASTTNEEGALLLKPAIL